MTGKSISLHNVELLFQTNSEKEAPLRVLDPINLEVPSQQFLAIVGPSGCGKTTILNMLAGLIAPSNGQIRLDQSAPRLGEPGLGYLLARDALLPWRSALENVALPLEIMGVTRTERERRGRIALREVHLEGFSDSYPAQLSHGMRQRVAVARTLVAEPTTLLMDEPFSALDAQTRLGLQQQFLSLWEKMKSTVLFVTHDLAEAILLADRVVVFSARPGRIKADFKIEFPRPRDLTELQGSSEFHEVFQKVWGEFRTEVKLEGSPE